MRRIRDLARQIYLSIGYTSSKRYWQRRYRAGLTSGEGSYGELASYKAGVINAFVAEHGIRSVIELGCGDGNQLSLAAYPRYLGLDVSKDAIDMCSERFADDRSKSFLWYDPERTVNLGNFLSADLALSLDVIYHLTEDSHYDRYLENLFSLANQFVVVYSSDELRPRTARHVRHRHFTLDIAERFPEYTLTKRLDNPLSHLTHAKFFFFQRTFSDQ